MDKTYAKCLKTGDIYEILNLKSEMKDPIEGLRVVSYKKYKILKDGKLEDPGAEFEGRIFVREYQDFRENFELCLGI